MIMIHVFYLMSVFDFYTVLHCGHSVFMLLVPSVDPSLHTIFHFGGVYCLFHFTQFHFDITVVQDGVRFC